MAIGLILAALAATALGAAGHSSAKETNERAESIQRQAKRMYDECKEELEKTKQDTEKALLNLGYAKKKSLDITMAKFIEEYDKIKHITLKESIGISEIENFTLDEAGILELQQMSSLYSSSVASAAAGAATGSIIALAASGALPVVTSGLSVAGSLIGMGQIGAAASMAGSALSLGASMTPLAAVAAPIVLFTGISASFKADENLEKAQTMMAQAEKACAQMEISETICFAISERSEMFEGLLVKLDAMLADCTNRLSYVIRKKQGVFGNKPLTVDRFTENELKLAAVTRAVAGAVKAILDTPIISDEGNVTEESETIYNSTSNALPELAESVNEVCSPEFTTVAERKIKVNNLENKSSASYKTWQLFIMWGMSIVLAIFGLSYLIFAVFPFAFGWLAACLVMCPKLFKNMSFKKRLLIAIVLIII